MTQSLCRKSNVNISNGYSLICLFESKSQVISPRTCSLCLTQEIYHSTLVGDGRGSWDREANSKPSLCGHCIQHTVANLCTMEYFSLIELLYEYYSHHFTMVTLYSHFLLIQWYFQGHNPHIMPVLTMHVSQPRHGLAKCWPMCGSYMVQVCPWALHKLTMD